MRQIIETRIERPLNQINTKRTLLEAKLKERDGRFERIEAKLEQYDGRFNQRLRGQRDILAKLEKMEAKPPYRTGKPE